MDNFIKNKYFLLFILVLLFIFTRMAIMFSSERLIWQGEEAFVGAITKGIIEGWAIPPFDYQQTPYFGGTIFNAIVTVPSFLLFGSTFFALRFTSILFHASGLILLFLLLSKYFSIRSAFFACFFYIFSPPLLTARSLIFNGGHAETAVFSILILFIFLNLIYKKPSQVNYSLLGLVSGFSLWYAYSNIISIINYSIAWFLKSRKFFYNKLYLLYFGFFIIGISPWFVFNIRNNFGGLEWITDEFSNLRIWDFKAFLIALQFLIFKYGYKIFMFDQASIFAGNIFNIIYYLVFVISLIFLSLILLKRIIFPKSNFRKWHSNYDTSIKEIVILTFPITFVFMYAFSNRFFYESGIGIVDYRYDIIVLPFIFIIIALFIDKLFGYKNIVFKFMGGLLFISLILIGIIGNGRYIYSLNFTNAYLSLPAYDYRHVGAVAFRRYGSDIKRAQLMMGKIRDKHDLPETYIGYGELLGIEFEGIKNLGKYIELSNQIQSERYKKRYFWGIGEGTIEAFYRTSYLNTDELKKVFLQSDNSDIDNICKNYLYFGMLGRLTFMRGHEFNGPTIKEVKELISEKYRNLAYLFYGLSKGIKVGRVKLADYISFCENENIELPYNKYYYMGIGMGIADFFSCDIKKAVTFFDKFPKDRREFLLQGMGLYFYKISNFDRDAFEDKIAKGSKEYKQYFREGIEVFHELVDHNP